ncbi:MAG: hypothetical protein AB7N76_13595 [Planctomycetota bacterium]
MSVSRVDKFIREILGTASLAAARDARGIPVVLQLSQNLTDKHLVMAEVLVDLALRSTKGPIVIDLERPHPGLADRLRRVARRFDPSSEARLAFDRCEADTSLAVRVGGTSAGNGIFADAAGWTASVNRPLPLDQEAAAPALAFACAAAFAKAFAVAVLGRDRRGVGGEAWSFCLRSFSDSESIEPFVRAQSIGRITLLGGGAIGSAFCYVLLLGGWEGELLILDRDDYAEPNEETTLLVSRRMVLDLVPKAETLATIVSAQGPLKAHGEKVEIVQGHPYLTAPTDFFVVAVDNPETRRLLDATGARVVVNGAVGGGASSAGHVLLSRHGVQNKPLSALYPPRSGGGEDDARSLPDEVDECSRVPYQKASLAAPFVGLASGALLAASCANIIVPANELSYLKFDLLARQGRFLRRVG